MTAYFDKFCIYISMNNNNRMKQLKQVDIENIIFIIYYFIITLSIISNYIEKNYLLYGNEFDKQTYRKLLFIIFGTVFLIYLYYTITGIKDLQDVTVPKIKRLSELSVLANILVLISGVIYLYIIYKDQDLNVELAFS